MNLSTSDLAASGQKPQLRLETLLSEAAGFAAIESVHDEPTLYGVTDGKRVGTYLEHKFQRMLKKRYAFETGSSAKGIDFPDLNVDMKVTSAKQPQSSSPFRSARQKVLGLGYSLLLFVYQKSDDGRKGTARLNIINTVFVDESRTADYQMTRGIREVIMRDGNEDDVMALMFDRNLPIDEDEALVLARELLSSPPNQGCLTISNALQWRLQYARAISQAGEVDGVVRVA